MQAGGGHLDLDLMPNWRGKGTVRCARGAKID